MSYYTVCRDITSFREIEEMEESLILPTFRRLSGFVDCNRPLFRKLMHKAFLLAKRGCGKWHDYEMEVAPFDADKPIYYEFTACPAAEFAKKHGLEVIMPALCHLDYTMSEAGGGTDFVRQYTLASGGPYCDCGYKKKA